MPGREHLPIFCMDHGDELAYRLAAVGVVGQPAMAPPPMGPPADAGGENPRPFQPVRIVAEAPQADPDAQIVRHHLVRLAEVFAGPVAPPASLGAPRWWYGSTQHVQGYYCTNASAKFWLSGFVGSVHKVVAWSAAAETAPFVAPGDILYSRRIDPEPVNHFWSDGSRSVEGLRAVFVGGCWYPTSGYETDGPGGWEWVVLGRAAAPWWKKPWVGRGRMVQLWDYGPEPVLENVLRVAARHAPSAEVANRNAWNVVIASTAPNSQSAMIAARNAQLGGEEAEEPFDPRRMTAYRNSMEQAMRHAEKRAGALPWATR